MPPTVDRRLVRELKNAEVARFHLGPRAGYPFRATPLRDAAEARACQDDLLTRLIRIWLANRGVWEAIVGAGPVCSVPAADDDVDAYLAGWDSLLARLSA